MKKSNNNPTNKSFEELHLNDPVKASIVRDLMTNIPGNKSENLSDDLDRFYTQHYDLFWNEDGTCVNTHWLDIQILVKEFVGYNPPNKNKLW